MDRVSLAPSPGSVAHLGRFRPSPAATRALVLATVAAALARLAAGIASAWQGDTDLLTAYGFAVILPLVILGLVLSLRPGPTLEGALMRIATATQMILIAAVPSFALQLALGLPVAFLVVELCQTRLPRRLRAPVERWLVSC